VAGTAILLALALPARAVDLDVVVGFAQAPGMPARYRPDSWTPVTVLLHGAGANGQAVLQLHASFAGRSTLYTRRFALRDGPVNQIERFSILPAQQNYWSGMGMQPDELTATLTLDGRQIADRTISIPIPIDYGQYTVLALTPDQSGLSFLTKKELLLTHHNVTHQNWGGMTSVADTNAEVLYDDPVLVPDMAQGYDAIDAVVFGALSPDALTESQQRALKDWIRRGGLLIVTGGADTAHLNAAPLAELLPIRPSGAEASDCAQLVHRYRAAIPAQGPILVTTGTLKPSARVLLPGDREAGLPNGRGGSPLVSACSYGSGTVVFVAFDAFAPEFRGWSAAPQLWRDLLRCSPPSLDPIATLRLGELAAVPENENSLVDGLAGARASRTPSWEVLALFLAAYIILLVPVSYFILKRLDRRDWAWITAPIVIVAFTAGSYVAARSVKGGLLNVNRAVVVEGSAGSDGYSGYGMFTVYAPSRARLDVNPFSADVGGGSDATPAEIWQQSSMAEALDVDLDGGGQMHGVPIRLWDTRSFDYPFSPSLGGSVQMTATPLGGGNYRLQVRNRTRLDLQRCAVLFDGNSRPIGHLAPGASAVTTVHWGQPNMVSKFQLPDQDEQPYGPATDTPQDTRRRIQKGLTTALTTNEQYAWRMPGQDMPTGVAPHAFVGWCYDDLMRVRIDGRAPQGEEVNLIYIRIPTPRGVNTRAAVLADPFRAAPPSRLKDVPIKPQRPVG
jgi:hypothetical protein